MIRVLRRFFEPSHDLPLDSLVGSQEDFVVESDRAQLDLSIFVTEGLKKLASDEESPESVFGMLSSMPMKTFQDVREPSTNRRFM